ncbi:MAG: LytTR family transcriptional regulator DNA-binding domain-containing protein [bacterium]
MNNERITVSKLLIRFEEVLTDYGFKRVSRSTLVNISHVSQIILSNNSRYLLINGIKIKISRRRLYLFRNK